MMRYNRKRLHNENEVKKESGICDITPKAK